MAGRAGPGMALCWAAAGVLSGYLLIWIYYALPRELIDLPANRRMVDFIRPMFDSLDSARTALLLGERFLLAVPGGLVLGVLAGVAMARASHPRLLCYGALLWPAWVLAESHYRYVASAYSSSVQYHTWLARGISFVDVLLVVGVFLPVLYVSRRLALR